MLKRGVRLLRSVFIREALTGSLQLGRDVLVMFSLLVVLQLLLLRWISPSSEPTDVTDPLMSLPTVGRGCIMGKCLHAAIPDASMSGV